MSVGKIIIPAVAAIELAVTVTVLGGIRTKEKIPIKAAPVIQIMSAA